MNSLRTTFCMAITLLSPVTALSYELNAHDELSRQAANASVITTDDSLFKALGLRSDQTFENSEGDRKIIVELVRDGARFEDNGIRAINHFYNPLNDRPLVVPLFTTETSPNWALEDLNLIAGQNFSYRDTRAYFYLALTMPRKTERDRNFGLAFQSLGQVIHHIQDMAQPQHVRLDEHCDSFFCRPGRFNPSRYEAYTGERLGSLSYSGYPPVRLTRAREFWHTDDRKGIADYTNRGFVSAGTNPSVDFPEPRFIGITVVDVRVLFPTADPPVAVPTECQTDSDPCFMSFLHNEVMDSYDRAFTRVNERATTVSIFDQDLRIHAPAIQVFSLNRFNYDAAHEFLIKRAVAYSAGLIDYFLRGRLETQAVSFAERNGRVEVSLKVRNAIDIEKVPAWASEDLQNRQGDPSQFVLTVKYKQGEEEKLVPSPPVGFKDQAPIKPGETSQEVYTFTLPVLPEDATEIEYRLVYRGRLGQEDDAIAVGIVEHVSGFLVQPNYLPDDGLGGRRLITKAAGTWRLSPEQGLQAGNIDWKGAYVNGRATKVLSWFGPKARYFPDRLTNPFGNAIYQAGERFAVAPCSVLGAAVARDAQDKEWLVIICNTGASDAVFRRPNTKSDSIALFDSVTNPDGWQEIAAFPWQSNWQPANRPWFFNGDGSEAQTMRQFQNANKLDRLLIKMEPDVPSAQLTNLGNLDGITDSTTVKHIVQGAAPAGICDRDKSASGHEHREARLTRTLSGGYVMVVDYDNKTEILGTIVASGTNEFVQILDQDWNCLGDLLEQESATMQITQIAGESTEFRFGTQGKVIPVRKQTGSASATLSKFSSDNMWLTGSGTATITDFRVLGDLYYLDLRHGLYVAREGVNRDFSSTGAIVDRQVCITRTGEALGLQQISYTREIPIDEQITDAAASFCSSNVKVPGVEPIFSNPGVEVTHVIFPTLPIRAVEGSWVVSSGEELFVSQEYRDKDSNLKVFNFLTDGDPKALIPTAPEDARYFPIRLIK